MFTGLVQSVGQVAAIDDEPPGKRLAIRRAELAGEAKVGDSVAVNGCCLTVVEIDGESLVFQAGPETLSRTNLGALSVGDRVNLETSLRAGEPLGGHFVTGHIDAVGQVIRREDEADWSTFWFKVPAALTRQMISKGSIAVDGVSLTLVDVQADRFSVQLIPHTLSATTLGAAGIGTSVNIETDILAKYVEKSLRR